MSLVSTVNHTLSLLENNVNILPAWVQNLLSFNTTYAGRADVVTLGVTSTPNSIPINDLAGPSPVALLIINSGSTDVTALGVAGFTQTVPAGKWCFMPAFITTSDLTLSVASGTGEVVLVILD
jgi:hypothetical protein